MGRGAPAQRGRRARLHPAQGHPPARGHLIDHLAQVEALLAGVATQPNHWQESAITTDADLAVFTEADLREAVERLTRLSRTLALRVRNLAPAEWDRPRGSQWTLREIVEHVADPWYAEQVGDLSRPSTPPGTP